MNSLNINEIHNHLLKIAIEFNKICELHNIPYYMIGGTLLGAVRHKGFIPWDDDMDFGVPIDRYEELLGYLRNELSEPYRVCTYKTEKGCSTVFAKIDDFSTVIEDKCQDIPLKNQLGLNIDLFPLCYCRRNDVKNKYLQFLRGINSKIFTESTEGQYYKHLIKKVTRFFFPLSRKKLLDKIWDTTLNIRSGDCLANLFGVFGDREFIPSAWFGSGKLYDFESTTLKGPERFDEYLSQIYGDYMTLPPVEKRKTHASNVYLRRDIL